MDTLDLVNNYLHDEKYKTANLVIWKSATGRDGWELVKPEAVPEWVKDPDVLGRLVAGDMCCDPAQGDKGSDWYRAERIELEGTLQ